MFYSPNIAVNFDHVVKEYKLYKNDRSRILSTVFKGIKHKDVLATNDISFTVYKGESVALIGRNGAGKSTILKLITGAAFPTSGSIYVDGRISPLLDLTTGFDMNLTGRQNLKLRGHVNGMTDSEIKELAPEVIKFAEIGQYIDQPMRTYSSGMKARLGFALASSVPSDLLIVDEALAVGDAEFNKKCLRRVKNLILNNNMTVLFVTHSASMAKQFCSRGMIFSHGNMMFDGFIEEALEFNDALMAKEAQAK